jgi:hypothetical protein
MTSNRLYEYFNEKISSDGVYEVYCAWYGGKAHVFCAEMKNGAISFFDPQRGLHDVFDYIENMNPELVGVIRIDDKIINPKIGGLFIKK